MSEHHPHLDTTMLWMPPPSAQILHARELDNLIRCNFKWWVMGPWCNYCQIH